MWIAIQQSYRTISFAAALCLSILPVANAGVFQCTDSNGKKIYTDNKNLCRNDKNTTVIAKPANKPNTSGTAVNFRIPARSYNQVGNKFSIYVEQDLFRGDRQLADAAIQKLENSLDAVFATLPQLPATKLKKLNFYLMWGEKSPNGGRKSGMAYFRAGKPSSHPNLDTRWDNVIVIYSAPNLMYLDTLWTNKALMHELAHAWHLNNWKQQHPPIINAYQNAKQKRLYRNVKDYKGRQIAEAYALKNHLEYFAELSAIYFVGGNYYPNNREEMGRYDSVGTELIISSWMGTTEIAKNQK